jgi:hypothetical protein
VTDFFREVDEDLQRDRLLKLWRRFRFYLLGLVVAAVVGVVIYVVLRDQAASRRAAESAQYGSATELIEAGKPKEAAEALNRLSDQASNGYAPLSRLRAAEALVVAGDSAGALAVFDQLAQDQRVDRLYRDLATLRAAEQLIDRASSGEIDSRLAGLLAQGNPWRALASELVAIAALKAGKRDAARATLVALVQDPVAPPGVHTRAQELLDSLGDRAPEAPVSAAPAPDAAADDQPKAKE